jgi:hypothetical protein
LFLVRDTSAGGAIVGYSTGLTFDGHTVASSNAAAQALFLGIRAHYTTLDLRVMMPFQTAPVLGRWCVENGWRVVKHVLLMSHGASPTDRPATTNDSEGVFIPTADG